MLQGADPVLLHRSPLALTLLVQHPSPRLPHPVSKTRDIELCQIEQHCTVVAVEIDTLVVFSCGTILLSFNAMTLPRGYSAPALLHTGRPHRSIPSKKVSKSDEPPQIPQVTYIF